MISKFLFVGSLVGLATTSNFAQITQIPSQANIIAYYPFNGNANDAGPQAGLDGTPTGGAMLTTDRFGNADEAYYFDGVNDYIDCGADTNFAVVGGNLTIAFWYRYDQAKYGAVVEYSVHGSNVGYLVDNAGASNYVNNFRFVGANAPSGLTYSGATNSLLPDSTTWHHCAWVFDNSETRLYKDGVLINTFVRYALTAPPTNTLFHIGRRNQYINSVFQWGYYKGKLDDVILYRSALDSLSIDSLFQYNSHAPTNVPKVQAQNTIQNTIRVYPNPTQNLLTLDMGKPITTDLSATLYSIHGQAIRTYTIRKTETSLDLHDLPSGNYLLVVIDGNTIQNIKIQKH